MIRVYRNHRKLKDCATRREAMEYCEQHARKIVTSGFCVEYVISYMENGKAQTKEIYTVIIG